jgi:hypothetical protein
MWKNWGDLRIFTGRGIRSWFVLDGMMGGGAASGSSGSAEIFGSISGRLSVILFQTME